MDGYRFCKRVAGKSGSNFYLSFFFLPKKKRRAIRAIYAFCRFVDDIADGEGSGDEKERMFLFVREEIEKAYSTPSSHPLTGELAYVAREFGIPKEYFIAHLDGARQDMVKARYETFADLKGYCFKVASVVGLILLKVFGVDREEMTEEVAVDLGLAFQLTNILRDVSEDAHMGRIYIPMEDMRRFDVTEEDILKGRYSGKIASLLVFEWERARDIFERAMRGIRGETKLLPVMVMANTYYSLLMKMRGGSFNPFDERIFLSRIERAKAVFRAIWSLLCRKEVRK